MDAVSKLEQMIRKELDNELLWHATSSAAFKEILADGFLRPTPLDKPTWHVQGHACQSLGAVALFDFAALRNPDNAFCVMKSEGLLTRYKPTIIIGIARTGKVITYPETRDLANSPQIHGPIPYVEVCRVGPIPVSDFRSYYIFSASPWHFEKHSDFEIHKVQQALDAYQSK